MPVTTSKAEINASVFRLPSASPAVPSHCVPHASEHDVCQRNVRQHWHKFAHAGGRGAQGAHVKRSRVSPSSLADGRAAWSPVADGKLVTVDHNTLYTWDIDVAAPSAKVGSLLRSRRSCPRQSFLRVPTVTSTRAAGTPTRSVCSLLPSSPPPPSSVTRASLACLHAKH